jgi:Domain of unknown function (DUF4160)
MPTVLILNGFRFFFYSNENDEPAHVHVNKAGKDGKLWLDPVLSVAYFYGFSNSEQKEIIEIANLHYVQFKVKWNEYFSK